jgi:hypothetical protein
VWLQCCRCFQRPLLLPLLPPHAVDALVSSCSLTGTLQWRAFSAVCSGLHPRCDKHETDKRSRLLLQRRLPRAHWLAHSLAVNTRPREEVCCPPLPVVVPLAMAEACRLACQNNASAALALRDTVSLGRARDRDCRVGVNRGQPDCRHKHTRARAHTHCHPHMRMHANMLGGHLLPPTPSSISRW